MVGICPGAVHGEVDAFDETLIVAAEQRFNGSWNLDEKEGEAKFEEKEDRKHAAGFSAEGARLEAKGGTRAGPKNGSVNCKFPSAMFSTGFSILMQASLLLVCCLNWETADHPSSSFHHQLTKTV
jgi:hypothetical protein